MRRRFRSLLAAAALWLAAAAPAVAVGSDFGHPASNDTSQQFTRGANVQRQDTPNDPDYDQAEPDRLHGHPSSNLYDERFDLFGFPSELAPSAVYRDGPHAGLPMVAGFNASGAWKAERGRPDTVIAILDTGINWGEQGLRLQIHLNTRELPYPEAAAGASCGRYDCNGDGVVDVADWAHDPRVAPKYTGRTGTHGSDRRPGPDRASDAAEAGNDVQGAIGACPHCQIMPVRIWDTFVSDGNTFGMGIVYAADNGARVIEGGQRQPGPHGIRRGRLRLRLPARRGADVLRR